MIALGTNVLVRYVVQDGIRQAAQAAKLIESSCTAESPGLVDVVVLCELVWVLESACGYERRAVALVLRRLPGAELVLISADQAWAALRAYESGHGGFSDHLIGVRNRAAVCETTFTFDKRAANGAAGVFTLVQ